MNIGHGIDALVDTSSLLAITIDVGPHFVSNLWPPACAKLLSANKIGTTLLEELQKSGKTNYYIKLANRKVSSGAHRKISDMLGSNRASWCFFSDELLMIVCLCRWVPCDTLQLKRRMKSIYTSVPRVES